MKNRSTTDFGNLVLDEIESLGFLTDDERIISAIIRHHNSSHSVNYSAISIINTLHPKQKETTNGKA